MMIMKMDNNAFYDFLKQENKRLQEKIDSNNDLIEFMEAGGYVEWNHQE